MEFCEVDDAESCCASGHGLEPAVEDADVDGELGDYCVAELKSKLSTAPEGEKMGYIHQE